MLETGSITELAAGEKIDRSYLCRMLPLTLLAPETVEAILDGRQPEGMAGAYEVFSGGGKTFRHDAEDPNRFP